MMKSSLSFLALFSLTMVGQIQGNTVKTRLSKAALQSHLSSKLQFIVTHWERHRTKLLGLLETEWLTIRHALLTESIQNANVYINVLLGVFDEIQESLKWSKPEFAPRRYWMQMPETGVLIANAFGVIVVFISLGASVTAFPLWTSPEFLLPHRVVSFVFVNDNHFVMVELTGDYPMPTPTWYWSRFKSQHAAAWEMWYKQRLDAYTNWLESRRQPPGDDAVDDGAYGGICWHGCSRLSRTGTSSGSAGADPGGHA
ncbi:hypothetical protein E3N88_18256 [Mikania micrantha]|uniref:Uncharacterized protein n=1 Tax=Mikania micrantha TaxID=192012 RepID=A0A5N6NVL3_9ASTR|nr:hypothetical protein E3N88_18256 [Mikania micrantha]